MKIKMNIKAVAISCLLGVLSVGCHEPVTLEFQIVSAPLGDVLMTPDRVELEEGFAVVARVIPIKFDEQMDPDTRLSLHAGDSRVLSIEPVAEADGPSLAEKDDEGDWRFSFAGASEGTTHFEYRIDGRFEGEIAVRVLEQR
jgi:hypothetical protein